MSALPGFREMTERRRRVIGELARVRRAEGLSQTVVAARMGTSQSVVARLETGELDVRLSTLERYAAAVGRRLDWQLRRGSEDGRSGDGRGGDGRGGDRRGGDRRGGDR